MKKLWKVTKGFRNNLYICENKLNKIMKKEKNYKAPMVLIQKTKLRASLLIGSNTGVGKQEESIPTGNTPIDDDFSVD